MNRRAIPRSGAAIGVLVIALAIPLTGVGAAETGGISGRVTSSPTCPVEPVPSQPQCAPRGFAARVRVYRLSDRHTIKTLTPAGGGTFRVRLRPGRYGGKARPATGAALPRCERPARAVVRPGTNSRIRIDCDSGIR